MKTASPDPALIHERCQHRTPKGRQCLSRILDPESSWCPCHSAFQPPDSKNFSAELTGNACDFQDPHGINHSLAALYKLLASGRISPRRTTGLAYIASMLLRTLSAINGNESTHFEIHVPPRPRFPEDDDGPRGKNPLAAGAPVLAPHNDASQFPPTQQNAYPPAVAGLPGQAPTPLVPSSNFVGGSFENLPGGAGSPFRSVPLPAWRGRFSIPQRPAPCLPWQISPHSATNLPYVETAL
jgi:hypothetical protein